MKEKIILKSLYPTKYSDLEIECRVISNEKIGEYLENISEDKKIYAHKKGMVIARKGNVGEEIKTILKTIVDGKEYVLSEESNVVKEREINGIMQSDVVVTNISSSSNEQYVVKYDKFCNTYTTGDNMGSNVYEPVIDSRLLTQIDENLIIITSWGEPAVCLKGSYIVTYDAKTNDYNTIEKSAFDSTYEIETTPIKTKQ